MSEKETTPVKETVSLEAFSRLDIRVGTIRRVEGVPGADRLIRLTVDFGGEVRTILAGMKKERDDPGEIQGLQALFLMNLDPRSMMGETSQGMILDIEPTDGGTRVLAVPERPVPPGSRLG